MLHVDTEWAYKYFIFNTSVSGRKKTELPVNGYYWSCAWNGLILFWGCGIKIEKTVSRKVMGKTGEYTKNLDQVIRNVI